MEVFAVFQHRSEVVILRSALGDYRVGAVVDHVRSALGGSVFRIVDSHASVFPVENVVDIHPESAQLHREGLADRIPGKGGQIP